VTVAPAAWAEDSETFFAQGRTLRQAGKCADAIVAFRRAFELKPLGLGSLRNVAECEEELGQFASARADWWSLRRAVIQSNEPKYDGWDRDAEAAYKRLEPKVAHLTVKVTGYSPENARVSIDGKPLDPRLVGVELERDVGPHTVEAAYGGAAPVSEKRELLTGAHEVVTLVIPVPKTPPRTGAPVGAPEVPEGGTDTGNKALRGAGIAALAVGGVGLVGAAISLAMRQSALAAFDGPCAAMNYMNCDPSLRPELTKGQLASTLLGVFGAVAGVGLVVGIPLVVVSRSSAPSPSGGSPGAAGAGVIIGLVPAVGGAAVHAGARF
jgi:hypothetical protein